MMFNSYAAGYASLPDGKSPNIPQRCPAPFQVEDAVWDALCTTGGGRSCVCWET